MWCIKPDIYGTRVYIKGTRVIGSATNYRDRNFVIAWTNRIETSAHTINSFSTGTKCMILLQKLKPYVLNYHYGLDQHAV
jgi:hypothetical protein